MADSPGLWSPEDISQLVSGVNAVLMTMHMTNDESIYQKVAFVDNGTTTNGTPIGRAVAGVGNGDAGQAGERMNYPMSPVSNAPKTWPRGVARAERDLLIINSYVDRDRVGIETERIYLDTQDPYQILSGKQGQVISRAGRAIDVLSLVDVINGNHSSTYDGRTYFHTARPVAPGSSKTFSNDLTCTNAQWASGEGMAILLDGLNRIPWFDGVLKDASMRRPVILAPTVGIALKARQLTGFGTTLPGGAAPLIPQVVNGVGVATGSSPFNGLVQDVVLFEDLANPTVYTDSDKYVYAVATMGGSVQPAFIVSPKRYPYMNVYGLSPQEDIRRKYGAIGWDWDGFWGAGYGLPQCCVRMLITG